MKKNRLVLRNGVLNKILKDLLKTSIRAVAALSFAFALLAPFSYAHIIEEVPDVKPDAVASASPIFHDSLLRGIDLIFNDQYEEGLAVFDHLQQLYPDHPAPYFFRAATYQNWMSSFRTNRFQEQLEGNVQLAIEKGSRLLKRDHNPWLHFYIGAAYGYRAFNRFRKHHWIAAYLDAKRGITHFEEALIRKPDLYDVYLGLGSYHYWRTSKSKFLRIIAFWMADKRELGLRQLEFSLKHGLYARHQASYDLIAAYFDYGQYEKALDLLNRTIEKKHAPTITDLYYKGRLFIKFKRWSEAESVFRRLLRRLEDHEFASVGYQVECRYWIAVALNAQNRAPEAFRWAEKALARSKKRHVHSELEGPFEDFTEIRKKLLRLHRNLKKETVNFLVDDGLPLSLETSFKNPLTFTSPSPLNPLPK